MISCVNLINVDQVGERTVKGSTSQMYRKREDRFQVVGGCNSGQRLLVEVAKFLSDSIQVQ